MNKLKFYFQHFVLNQIGKIIYRDEQEPICEVEFRVNNAEKLRQLIIDYNIGEIEIHNSQMANAFVDYVKKIEPNLNFTLKN